VTVLAAVIGRSRSRAGHSAGGLGLALGDVVDDVPELLDGREVNVFGVLERFGRVTGSPVEGLPGLEVVWSDLSR
jgi:hypothetical protein